MDISLNTSWLSYYDPSTDTIYLNPLPDIVKLKRLVKSLDLDECYVIGVYIATHYNEAVEMMVQTYNRLAGKGEIKNGSKKEYNGDNIKELFKAGNLV